MGNAQAGSAAPPVKTFEQKELERSEDPTLGARSALHDRDSRLNPHRASYGSGKWSGDSYIKAGGGTAVVPQKARPRTVPQQVGSDGSLSHPVYGQGAYVPSASGEHQDLAGFSKLSKRGCHDANNSTARGSALSRGDIDKTTNGYRYAAPQPSYGNAAYAAPVKGEVTGVPGVHFGSRNGGVSEDKYLPTHEEAVMGRNSRVGDYGQGAFASPKKAMVHARYAMGHPYEQHRDMAGYGAYVAPRSGVY